MERDPIRNDARRTARQVRLGDPAVCVLCGEGDPDTLVAPKVIEQHHLVNRANDETLTGPVCRNCHAKQTEQLRRAGVPTARPRTTVEWMVSVLRALAVLFKALGEACLRWAEKLMRELAPPRGYTTDTA